VFPPGDHKSVLRQRFNFFQKFSVFRHTFLDGANNTVPVYDKGYSAFTVCISNRAVFVRNKGKSYAVFFGEFFMGCNVVAAYAQNLGASAFKKGNVTLEGFKFALSDR